MSGGADTSDDVVLTAAQLDQAVALGLIEAGQRDSLIQLAAPPVEQAEPPLVSTEPAEPTEEPFRLVGGGNDVFVALGIILLMAGVLSALLSRTNSIVLTCCAFIAFCWFLAETVTRRKRMKLSSLIIALGFTFATIAGVAAWISVNMDFTEPDNPLLALDLRDDLRDAMLLGIGVTAIAALAWFARFRVPIMTAVLVLSALALVATGIADGIVDGILSWRTPVTNEEEARALGRSLLWVPLAMGLAVFAIGVFLDLKDRHRDTLLSDCAFWMHVISAPLIVHPLFVLATGTMPFFASVVPVEQGSGELSATITLLALVVLFFYVALAIDRRSLLVPALGYFATVGVVSLVQTTAATTGAPTFAVVLALVGILVITFGAGWQRIRRAVVGTTLPKSALDRLPPIAV
ncbi:MAG: hypothetical protein AAF764_04700 [Pseudomonadota bacterium]